MNLHQAVPVPVPCKPPGFFSTETAESVAYIHTVPQIGLQKWDHE
jgi:hypothetical protein